MGTIKMRLPWLISRLDRSPTVVEGKVFPNSRILVPAESLFRTG